MFQGLKKSFKSRKEPKTSPSSGEVRRFSSVSSSSDIPVLASPVSTIRLGEMGLSPPSTPEYLQNTGRSRSADRSNEPLGLQVLYRPDKPRAIDIIFVHGLGGTSRLTWSWNRDLNHFWPKEWLPMEPGFKDARILSFGYNAHFMSQTGDIFNISDFAKDLLLQMKFGSDENKQLEIGKVPVIFVVHSMGGLVFKKAFILGQNDPEYQGILNTICSVVFLATPHRGSGLASILSKLLSVSFHSPKQYVADLQKNSPPIVDINDQFRLHAPKMEIVSFFETLQSSVGPRKMMIVERDSAVLGYPNEISSPLNADHHTVCKYPSRQDANYINVRNVIGSFVSKFKLKGISRRSSTSETLLSIRSTLIRLIEPVESSEDQEALSQRCVPGSCDWILSEPSFITWASDSSACSSVLHLMGLPGSGKSVLASFLVRHFDLAGSLVQHFFFRFDDQAKKSIRNCLLSIAFQLALQLPEYAQRITSLLEDRNSITRSDFRIIWQKAFVGIMPKLSNTEPLYWIIDAVDESESATILIGLIISLRDLRIPIRVVLISRPNSASRSFEKLKSAFSDSFHQVAVQLPDSAQRLYIEQELESSYMWDSTFTSGIKKTLLGKCNGNLLWLRLVVDRLLLCNTEDDVDRALNEAPSDLMDLYVRIARSIASDLGKSELDLARTILSWVTCAERQLSLDELSEALQSHKILNLKHTIGRLCGDLVNVDNKGAVGLVHHTVKEFLTQKEEAELFIDSSKANEDMFARCLAVLREPRIRIRLKSEGCVGFLRYACLFWSTHLSRVDNLCRQHIRDLASFFQSHAVLAWINAIGICGNLRTLTQTSKHLTGLLERQRKRDAEKNPMALPLEDMEVIAAWATELVRIVGKFGHHIVRHPSAVHSLIPAFCPPLSMMAKQFAPKGSSAMNITGVTNPGWDDSLAKFTVGCGTLPTEIACLNGHFAILASEDIVNLYHSSTFQEARRFNHGEVIVAVKFSQDGDKVATCGRRSIKIWCVATARVLHNLPNPHSLRAVDICFSQGSSRVLICCDDSSIRYQDLSCPDGWQLVEREARDDSLSRVHGTPSYTAFNPEGTQIAVSFRAAPLLIWSTESGKLIGACERVGEKMKSRQDAWCDAQRVRWNPITGHILGIYNEGSVFKCYPLDSETREPNPPIKAHEIACASDGRTFITATGDGSLRMWNFDNFSLLYHLRCSSPVTAMTLSFDGRRIYDLRESCCNVWEPNSLIRMADADDIDSETSGSRAASANFSLVSETSAVILEPITALAVGKRGTRVCFCNEAGMLTVVPGDGSQDSQVKCSFMGISCMAWSNDECLIATAEIDGTVAVRQAPSAASRSLAKTYETKSQNPVLQLLFDQKGQRILVKCFQFTNIWSVSDGAHLACRPAGGGEPSQWMLHPFSDDSLISISSHRIEAFTWDTLIPLGGWAIDFTDVESRHIGPTSALSRRPSAAYPMSPSETESSVDKVFISPGASFIFVQVSKRAPQGRCIADLFILETSFLQSHSTSAGSSPTVAAMPLPAKVSERVEVALGFVLDEVAMGSQQTGPRNSSGAGSHRHGCSLAFLDRDFWLCTWSMDDLEGHQISRHFFLPRDWVNMDCLDMALITEDGRFVCPRNGELAVVSNGLRQPPWVE